MMGAVHSIQPTGQSHNAMVRWLVKLEGNPSELQLFPTWFPKGGEAYAFEEDGSVYLSGSVFEEMEDSSEVYKMALETLDGMTAIISLIYSDFQQLPSIGMVIAEDDKGKRTIYSRVSTAYLSLRASPASLGSLDHQYPTQAQRLLSASSTNTHLQRAVWLWADQNKSWPRLYVILEELERYLGQSVANAGFCSKKQQERFARSANNTDTAGRDARHASGKFEPLKNPMSLAEAKEFIGGLLKSVLAYAVDQELSSDCGT